MNDLAQLERFTDNFIIDELTWHLANRGIPESIDPDCSDIQNPKAVFRFSSGRTWTHEIDPGLFVDHWNDAAEVIRDFPTVPQLAALPETLTEMFRPYREKQKEAIAKWKADTKQTSEQVSGGNGGQRL